MTGDRPRAIWLADDSEVMVSLLEDRHTVARDPQSRICTRPPGVSRLTAPSAAALNKTTMNTRQSFDHQMATLDQDVVRLGSVVEEMLDQAMQSLLR